MKKRIITLSEFRNQSPYKYGKLITALNRNRVKTKETKNTKVKIDFSKDILENYILENIRK
jgi:hypothetical protein